MTQDRLSPGDFSKLYHRSVNNSLNDLREDNVNRAMNAFQNLNPAAAANRLKTNDNTPLNGEVTLDMRYAVLYLGVAVIVGALGSFAGAWMWTQYKEGKNK